ncbi:lauroyl acyltransferase [Lysobacter sp. TY2-98]|uniref:lauroyl acyltransferase n=1 Tax=Lysobacter sp. TY2-98 TaxID=2290922 RepID=UPI000E1FC52F|nr:lauroyl acyltransferase [Lysobacter sp. TY2-98]AXK73411.1 lauroyl acyltransferase [Lysobacter sp. TY2-98]
MPRVLAALLYALAATAARLPWRWLAALGDAIAAAALRRNSRESRITLRNLELIQPDAAPADREALRRDVVRVTARQALETLRFWTRPHSRNLADIVEHHGAERLDAAIAAGRGVIVVAPHYGNWELLNQWLASRTPLAILYAPPESAIGDAFLQRVRAAHGDASRVTQIRAEAAGARQLFKWLQGGGVVGILPDQQPKQGDGEFAPFFGRPALTMSLLGRLAARTGATVLIAWCERIGEDARGPRFALHLEPVDEAVADRDIATSVAALNHAIERVARRDLAQYQWTYKRFSIQPDGINPYWPDCY